MNDGSNRRVLVAGIGNIFLGDDAFGVEVARELTRRRLPWQVKVMDVGIRTYDLAYALAENYDLVILVDAIPRGQSPGTVYLLELNPEELAELGTPSADAHNLDLVQVLQMGLNLGDGSGKLYLVGCEPSVLEDEAGSLTLSQVVQAAVPRAADRIESLIRDFLRERTSRRSRKFETRNPKSEIPPTLNSQLLPKER
jgi:hydrogenase maturation protease